MPHFLRKALTDNLDTVSMIKGNFVKETRRFSVALLLLLLVIFPARAQANDEPARPTSPKDRASPIEEVNAPTEEQPLTLRVAGANLRDKAGSPIGRVEDLVIDPESGRIDFLVVSTFFPTNSTKLMSIPWKAVTYRADQSGMGTIAGANQVFALNFPRTKLQQAPAFEPYRWPDMSQDAWRQPIYNFYSIKNGDAAGATGNQSQTSSGSGPGIESPASPDASRLESTGDLPADFIGPRIPSATGMNFPATGRTDSALPSTTARRQGRSTR